MNSIQVIIGLPHASKLWGYVYGKERQVLLIGTNWKMHKTRDQSARYALRLTDYTATTPPPENVRLLIIPSFLSLASVSRRTVGYVPR